MPASRRLNSRLRHIRAAWWTATHGTSYLATAQLGCHIVRVWAVCGGVASSKPSSVVNGATLCCHVQLDGPGSSSDSGSDGEPSGDDDDDFDLEEEEDEAPKKKKGKGAKGKAQPKGSKKQQAAEAGATKVRWWQHIWLQPFRVVAYNVPGRYHNTSLICIIA